MRRRLLRLAVVVVALPVASRGADLLADRMEATSGPSRGSRSLRQASRLLDRQRRHRRRW